MYYPMFRDVLLNKLCPRGDGCTYAHSSNELRPSNGKISDTYNDFSTMPPPPLNTAKMGPPPMDFEAMSVFDAFAPPNTNDASQMQPPLIPMVPVMMPQPTITDIALDQQAAMMNQQHCMVGAYVVIFIKTY
jgi:hypothetical protein